jgi:uncharacterized caspase-like protein
LPADAPTEFSQLDAAQPEDGVFIYFAGHGTTDGARFYLIPHDLGFAGSRDAIDDAALKSIMKHSVSDEELDKAFEGVDAGRIVLFIDACNSGQALEAEEKRRGPMNSKGLAQLAYEKGMYILTAAQAYQPAIETSAFKDANGQGHGLLTYALVEEGLAQGKAGNSDGNVYLREWLDYASQEVPQLQSEWLTGALKTGRGFKDQSGGAVNPTDPSQVGLQRPRVFYRRENDASPFVVGKVGVAPAAQ